MLNVFDIQRFSLHDGDGIRTNIFFKGCPLRCQWCNNPEGIESSPVIMFNERLCHRFGDCMSDGSGRITVSDDKLLIRRDLIAEPGPYRKICPSKALTVSGSMKSIADIMHEIEKDIPFYRNSMGGVTLTGGEPFMQGPELLHLIMAIREKGINVSAETSLHMVWEEMEDYIRSLDVILADLKHTDKAKFAQFTGGDASLVMNNFRKLDRTGKGFIVRVPVIPGFNFTEPELHAIIDFASRLRNVLEIDFIPYHDLAREKYLMAGKEYIFGNHRKVEKKELAPFAVYAGKNGLIAKIMN